MKLHIKKIDWDEYIDLMYKLGGRIRKSKDKLDCVYGIPRGGLIPATFLSHYLNIPLVTDMFEYKGNLLVVDDLVDSGKALTKIYTTLLYAKIISATLHYKPQSTITPDFYVEEVPNDVWIHYCYERD